jgi:hypothetical protein
MLSSSNNVVVLCWKTPAPSENNARKIAEFLGVEVTVVAAATAPDIASIRQLIPPCAALLIHADTLVRMAEVLATGVSGLLSLIDLAAHVFIHGFEPTDRHACVLRTLTSDRLLGVEPLPTADMNFRIADNHREWCGQFSGLSVQGIDRTRDAGFREGAPQEGQAVLVRAAGRPFFVRIGCGTSKVFLTACNELADLDEKVSCGGGLLPWFSRLVPMMIFLRSALGEHVWHSDCPRACFIIDDPLLTHRYGFLEYAKLLETMGKLRFSACIAFIPWNYRRSRQQIADLFSTAPSALSLCIHGCDHTKAEFAAARFDLLCGKAQLALDRMNVHTRLSGIPFDDVMVFPQGLFSCEAVKALEARGYLSAINTDLCPSNLPQALTLRDLMEVAVTAFADFPLFGRHYPRDPAEFAFDLFLGKPALVVEHHGYFRDGHEALGIFVKRLNALDERLEWTNLATICSRACLKRVTPHGDVHLRFYTNRFQFMNVGTQTQTYLLFRQRTSDGPLPAVTVNGRPCAREQKESSLIIRLSLGPGQKADIRILSDDLPEALAFPWKPTRVHNAKVFVRRTLCELRDNHVETNRLLGGLLSSARRLRARAKDGIKAAPQTTCIES